MSHLSDAHRILRPTADEVELPEPPDLDGPVGPSAAAHRLVEGVAAPLAGGSTQPLTGDRGQQGSRWRWGGQRGTKGEQAPGKSLI